MLYYKVAFESRGVFFAYPSPKKIYNVSEEIPYQ